MEKERRIVANGVPRELGAIRKGLNRIMEQQSRTNRERYNRVRQEKDTEASQRKSQTLQRGTGGGEPKLDGITGEVEKANNVSPPHRPYIWFDARHIRHLVPYKANHRREQYIQDERRRGVGEPQKSAEDHYGKQQERADTKNQEQGEIVNDSTGAEITGRIRAIRERTAKRSREIAELGRELQEEH